MRYLFLFILSLAFTNKSFSQENIPVSQRFSFAVRGKFLAIGGEDQYCRGYSYGGELIYKNRHCIGIDGGVFRARREEDDYSEKAMYSQIYRRSYVLIDYKCRLFTLKGNPVYLNVYGKPDGKYWNWYKWKRDNYPFSPEDDTTFLRSTQRGRFKDWGIGIGTKIYFGESPFGFDASINVYRRFGSHVWYHHKDKNTLEITEESENYIRPYIRMTFFYHFFHQPAPERSKKGI